MVSYTSALICYCQTWLSAGQTLAGNARDPLYIALPFHIDLLRKIRRCSHGRICFANALPMQSRAAARHCQGCSQAFMFSRNKRALVILQYMFSNSISLSGRNFAQSTPFPLQETPQKSLTHNKPVFSSRISCSSFVVAGMPHHHVTH